MALPVALNIHAPLISTAYDELLLYKKRAIAITQSVRGFAQITMLRNGLAINLDTMEVSSTPPTNDEINDPAWDGFEWNDWDTFVFDSEDTLTESSSSGTITYSIKARFREASLVQTTTYEVDCVIFRAEEGIVRAPLPEQVSDATGIWLMEVGIFNEDDELILTNEVYVYNVHSAFGAGGTPGPPTIDDVRLSLRDADPVMNELLDNYDFDLAEIAHAAVRVVQFWRDQPPSVAAANYSTRTFPFREIWLTGIQLFCFETAEEGYRRNRLPYQAGNVTIDDKNRHRDYKAAWQERFQRFRQLVMHQKSRINAQHGFGSFGSGIYG